MSRTNLAMLIIVSLFAALALTKLPASQYAGGAPFSSGPANLAITNFSVPATISVNAPLDIFLQLQNGGGLATSNITLGIYIECDNKSTNFTYVVSPLSPYQGESFVISLYNKTTIIGPHNISIVALYHSNGTARYASSAKGNYDVVSMQNPPIRNAAQVMQSNDLQVTYIPVYTTLFSGSEVVSEIGVKDTGQKPELLNISTGKNYSSLITLSTRSLYLQPDSPLYVQFVLKAQGNKENTTTYVIPMNFTITPQNGTPSALPENIAFTIKNMSSSEAGLLDEVTLINSSNSTTGIIEIYSAKNTSINNATIVTYLPISVAKNISSIKTNGLQANITEQNKTYKITWSLPYLPAGQVQYAYFQISNLENPQFPFHVSTVLTMPSVLRPTSLIKIVNFSLPTFYTNSTEKMGVDVLYTGTTEQKVYFYLTAPPGVTISNSTQVVNATPNQFINKDFMVKTGNTPGTMIFTIYIDSQDTNITYSLPIVVLQNTQVGLPAPTTTKEQSESGGSTASSIHINIKDYIAYIIAAVAILLIVLLIYGVMLLLNRPSYNRQRMKKLMDVKDQIKRQGGHVG
jgi:hypothetical protein